MSEAEPRKTAVVKLKAGDTIHVRGIPIELLGDVTAETTEVNHRLFLSQDAHISFSPAHATSPDRVATTK